MNGLPRFLHHNYTFKVEQEPQAGHGEHGVGPLRIESSVNIRRRVEAVVHHRDDVVNLGIDVVNLGIAAVDTGDECGGRVDVDPIKPISTHFTLHTSTTTHTSHPLIHTQQQQQQQQQTRKLLAHAWFRSSGHHSPTTQSAQSTEGTVPTQQAPCTCAACGGGPVVTLCEVRGAV